MRGFRFFSFKFIYPCRKSNKKKGKRRQHQTMEAPRKTSFLCACVVVVGGGGWWGGWGCTIFLSQSICFLIVIKASIKDMGFAISLPYLLGYCIAKDVYSLRRPERELALDHLSFSFSLFFLLIRNNHSIALK